MKITVFAEPGILYEIPDVHHKHVVLPPADRVAVVRRVGIGAMRTAVGWDDAVGITGNILIEENCFVRQLHDFSRRTDARLSRFAAVEHRV